MPEGKRKFIVEVENAKFDEIAKKLKEFVWSHGGGKISDPEVIKELFYVVLGFDLIDVRDGVAVKEVK